MYFDMSLKGSIKETIAELIYEAIEKKKKTRKSTKVKGGEKYKIPNEFSICNYLNYITLQVKIRIPLNAVSDTYSKMENGVNSYFKTYLTDPAILNDSSFCSKSNENIGNDITGTKSNEDLIEALKSKLLDEFMPYIKIFIKQELKFSKQENDLVNSNTEIIKSLEKGIRISKTRTC